MNKIDYEHIIKQNHYNIKNIPDESKTYEMCKYAVSRYGLLLEFIPEKFTPWKI